MKRLALLLLAACSSTPTLPPDVPTTPDPMPSAAALSTLPAESVFDRTLTARLMASIAAPTNVRGVIRYRDQKSLCVTDESALPFVWPRWKEPRAGQLLEIDWTTRAARPLPDELLILAVSFRNTAPVELSPWGHFGCWMAQSPDYLVAPGPGSIITKDEPGRVSLRWVPGDEWIGVSIYVQGLVMTDAGPAGWLVTPGLEIIVGSR